MKLYCVVPFYNEEASLPACIESLKSQTDCDFHVVFVDNASTDKSVPTVKRLTKQHPFLDVEVISESEKGTGSAVDTGFRYAIKSGASHIIRTDSDCVVDTNWVAAARAACGDFDLLLGKLGYRTDDGTSVWYDYLCFPLADWISTVYGKLFWRGPDYKCSFVMGAGHNMLITASAYEASGGFPRLPLETQDDDVALFDAVRRVTPKIKRVPSMKVRASLRRVRKYGYLKTMLYYWGRKYRPTVVDVR